MTRYQDRGKDHVPVIRKKRIFKTFAVLMCVFGACLFLRQNNANCPCATEKLDSSHSIDEDWFEGNITKFQTEANTYNYIVLRKTTVERYGDFSCHSSKTRGICAFNVSSLIEAIQICNAYADVCSGFALTRDMIARLKHQIRRLTYNKGEVTFIKNAFVARIGHSVAESQKLYGNNGA